MPILPTDTNDTPNYTPTEHATHHNVLAGLNNELGNFVQATAAPGSPAAGDLWLDTDEVAQSGTSVDLGYAEVTANQGSITTETDLTGLTKTVTVISGHRIKITAHIRAASTVNADSVEMKIKESTTVLALDRVTLGPTGHGLMTVTGQVVLTPSAGSHTYKLSLARNAGTGTISLSAAATFPAFILIEDLGVASA